MHETAGHTELILRQHSRKSFREREVTLHRERPRAAGWGIQIFCSRKLRRFQVFGFFFKFAGSVHSSIQIMFSFLCAKLYVQIFLSFIQSLFNLEGEFRPGLHGFWSAQLLELFCLSSLQFHSLRGDARSQFWRRDTQVLHTSLARLLFCSRLLFANERDSITMQFWFKGEEGVLISSKKKRENARSRRSFSHQFGSIKFIFLLFIQTWMMYSFTIIIVMCLDIIMN